MNKSLYPNTKETLVNKKSSTVNSNTHGDFGTVP